MKVIPTYLDLVEEYDPTREMSQFEKVLVLAGRAKDLYGGRGCAVDGLEGRKPTAMAQYEIMNHLLEPCITDLVEDENDMLDDMDEED